MAKEDDDLFDDIDDESEGEGGDEESGGEATGEGGPPKKSEADSDYLKEAIADLAEMGIHIPDSVTSPKDFVKHLCTAIKTHKATKDVMGQGQGGEATAESSGAGASEEESPMMMSTQRLSTLREHADPAVRELAAAQLSMQQEREVHRGLQKQEKKAQILRRIDRLEKGMVIKPASAEKYRDMANVIRLSLKRSGDGYAKEPVELILDAIEETTAAASLSARRGVREVPLPDGGEASEDAEIISALTDGRADPKALAGRKRAVPSGGYGLSRD